MSINRENAIKELRTLPRVGDKVASALWRLGIRSIQDLRFQSAEGLYESYNELSDNTSNRALLYIIRCGIYVSCTKKENRIPEKLNWFYWNDLKNPRCIQELEDIQNALDK